MLKPIKCLLILGVSLVSFVCLVIAAEPIQETWGEGVLLLVIVDSTAFITLPAILAIGHILDPDIKRIP